MPAQPENAKQPARNSCGLGNDAGDLNIVDVRDVIEVGVGRTCETETDPNTGITVNNSRQSGTECGVAAVLLEIGERCEGSKAAVRARQTVGERQGSEPMGVWPSPVKLLECEADRNLL